MAGRGKSGRRRNGEGSAIREDKTRGRFEAKITVDGKRITITGKTAEEVRYEMARRQRERDLGITAADGRQTLAQYLTAWLDTVKPTVRESAWIRYEQLVRVHLIPGLGRHTLAKLTAHHVQAFYAAKLAEGRISATTVRRCHDVLHHALHDAMRLDLVRRNVTELADAPRAVETEMRYLSLEQVARLIAAAQEDRLGALYVLAVTTGMRKGELLALRWRDVDLTCGTVSVRASLTRTTSGYIIGKPKTKRSERTLTLPEVAWDALREHRRRQNAERLATRGWREQDMVFSDEVGAVLDHDVVRHRYAAFLRRHALPDIRFHDLRHTAATVLVGEGENIKVVSARLGHSQLATTDRYTHVTAGMEARAAETMDRAIKRAQNSGTITPLRKDEAQ